MFRSYILMNIGILKQNKTKGGSFETGVVCQYIPTRQATLC